MNKLFQEILEAHGCPAPLPQISAKRDCDCEAMKPEGWDNMSVDEKRSYHVGFHAGQKKGQRKIAELEKDLGEINASIQLMFRKLGSEVPFDA